MALCPTHFWSEKFAQRAFGKSTAQLEEILKPVARAVFLDEKENLQVCFLPMDATNDEIISMNERVRPLVGGYGMFAPFPEDCSQLEGVRTSHPNP